MISTKSYRSARVVLTTLACLALAPARGQAQTVEWVRQLGSSSNDRSSSVSADGLGNVYISGYTGGSLGGQSYNDQIDAFVSKYDASGSLEWTRLLGTGFFDESSGVSADGLGNVYISGNTSSSLGGQTSAGAGDAFVSKYDAGGNLEWVRQLGTSSEDWSHGVSADGLGNVYVSGTTLGSLGGQTSAGLFDAFVSKYDAAGSLEWTRLLGSSSFNMSYGVSADGLGNVYISGFTDGSLGGPCRLTPYEAGHPEGDETVEELAPEGDLRGLIWLGPVLEAFAEGAF